tara:strand:- start:149 stop:739 length:591 start_codon:yes stop_codon:yes gene_type:complete
MGLISKPDLRKVTTTVFDALHPLMGDGVLIQTVHCNPKEKPSDTTLESFRFFPHTVENGCLYRKNKMIGNGKGLDSFCDDHAILECEVSELTTQVRDHTQFRKYRWSESFEGADDQDVDLEQDDKDPNRYRLIVRLTHITAHDGALVKETLFSFAGPWVTASSVMSGATLAHNAWKNHDTEGFFAKFPGVNCHCKL